MTIGSIVPVFMYASVSHRDLHSFPTRRSSDPSTRQSFSGRRRRPEPPNELPPCASVRCSRVSDFRSSFISASSERSEEHTSELQSQSNLVCRLLLEKKKNTISSSTTAQSSSTS